MIGEHAHDEKLKSIVTRNRELDDITTQHVYIHPLLYVLIMILDLSLHVMPRSDIHTCVIILFLHGVCVI